MRFKLGKNDIIYEDNHLLIVNKPAGILSQGDRTGDASIIDLAKDYIKVKYNKPGNVFLGLPHRLDRPVSGLIILCRTSKALTRMTKLIKEQKLIKIYHALTSVMPNPKTGQIISYLKKNSKNNVVTCKSNFFEGSKKAILSYKTKAELINSILLEVNLQTGRPHQIRVQLKSIGCPILGDVKYSDQKPLKDKSIALHSRRVEFEHPVQKIKLCLEAPYPSNVQWSNIKFEED